MRKPFITILQKGETAVQNTRIFSLLESLGLEDRIYHPEKGSMAGQPNRPINWTAVERNWEALRIHSMEFLKNAIQQCTSATRHG